MVKLLLFHFLLCQHLLGHRPLPSQLRDELKIVSKIVVERMVVNKIVKKFQEKVVNLMKIGKVAN